MEYVKIYDIEIPEPLYERLQKRVREIDPSGNYGKKHIIKQVCVLADHLLESKYDEISKTHDQLKREIAELEDVLDN